MMSNSGYIYHNLPIEGYFLAQWNEREAHVIESERGETKAIVKLRRDGLWELYAEWCEGKGFPMFRTTGIVASEMVDAASGFSRYIDGISRPWTITRAQYVAWGGRAEGEWKSIRGGLAEFRAGHREIVLYAVGRGESVPDEVLADYPRLQAIMRRVHESNPVSTE